MNETTQQILQQIAEKLGTTTEYLWGVLLNQAQYYAAVTIFKILFSIAFIVATIKIHFIFTKPFPLNPKETYRRYENIYEKYEMSAGVAMVFAGLASVFLLVFILTSFNSLVAALFNPEYWALTQILNSI